MIDYEKLKVAHNIAKNLNQPIGIEVKFSKKGRVRYILCMGCNDDDSHFNAFENIDKLIARLKFISADKCKHESDNTEHVMTDDGGSFSMNRCKKCGEFYK